MKQKFWNRTSLFTLDQFTWSSMTDTSIKPVQSDISSGAPFVTPSTSNDEDQNTSTTAKNDSQKELNPEALDAPVVKFKAFGKKNLKKRPADSVLDDEDLKSQVVKKAKTEKSVGLVDDEGIYESGVSVMEGTSYGFTFESSGTRRVGDSMSEFEKEEELEKMKHLREKQANHKPSSEDNKGKLANQNEGDQKLYKGQSAYKQYHTQSKYSGPIRAVGHVRADVRMDYARDICKDYKETGYCGYGDSCKFLHDRSDYAAGWQIEKEWEISESKRRSDAASRLHSNPKSSSSSTSSKSDDSSPLHADTSLKVSSTTSKDLPFACFICRKPFTNPVVTRCGHYFCQECALNRYITDKTCAVCKEPTGGSYNSGVKILQRRDALLKMQSDGST